MSVDYADAAAFVAVVEDVEVVVAGTAVAERVAVAVSVVLVAAVE